MIFLRYLLLWGGEGMLAAAGGLLARDIYLLTRHRQLVASPGDKPVPETPIVHWRATLALALLAWAPIILAMGIVVVPSGMAAVRISQTSGTLPGTLYSGAHFVTPLAESIV